MLLLIRHRFIDLSYNTTISIRRRLFLHKTTNTNVFSIFTFPIPNDDFKYARLYDFIFLYVHYFLVVPFTLLLKKKEIIFYRFL